ncbi:MAG: elongation factor EF-2 [Methanobacteriota archaeon]|nr:MAG: elongation factor EF-2 [Euryarchaeota archaeon]
MGIRKKMVSEIQKMMHVPENIRNIGIVAHIDHGKTTLSDNLLAAAGLISPELAGSQLYLDSDVQEQARGITINAANVSMVHEYQGEEYLINMIDTPGHVDFGGDVTRAMRAVDGVIVVACAVEGCMPQTETVVRQALKERVKPVLFINKVDRLINELKLTPEEMQNRFMNIINDFNKLIKKGAPKEFQKEWLANVAEGTVAFGSAYHNWAINVPYMQKSGITFKDIIEYNQGEKQKELAKKAPIAEILLDMVVKHLPDPKTAQRYRIPQIWSGDVESEEGRAMVQCDQKAKLAMMITDISIDPNAGEVATGRVFSGTIKKGSEVYLYNMKTKARIQQVGVYMGAERVIAEEVPAGNIAAITGLKEAIAGETISEAGVELAPFEEMKHTSEPVVTKAIEAKNMKDLPKLIEVLRQLAKEDPTLRVEINEETGEHLLSGMGELHLEITEYRIKEKGVDIVGSKPIVVYRESVTAKSGSVEGKSPNKHNRFYFTVEPLDKAVFDALAEGEIKPEKLKGQELGAALLNVGMDKVEAKGAQEIYLNNLFTDVTKGIQYLNEVIGLIIEGFHEAMDNGPLAKEKVMGVKVRLVDVKLHEDSIHRGPAQVIPAVRDAIRQAMVEAKAVLLEPMQKVFIHVPNDYMGGAIREVQSRRGQIIEMRQEQDMTIVEAKCPVADMFGFASGIRSATEGRALWATEHAGFERVPPELQDKLINEIRRRKGI